MLKNVKQTAGSGIFFCNMFCNNHFSERALQAYWAGRMFLASAEWDMVELNNIVFDMKLSLLITEELSQLDFFVMI